MYCVRRSSTSTSTSTSGTSSPAAPSRPYQLTDVSVCARPTATDFLTSQRRTRARPSSTYPSSSGAISDQPFPIPFSLFPPHDNSQKPVDDLRRSFWKPSSRQIEIEICSAGPRGLRPVPRKVHFRPVTHCQFAPHHPFCPHFPPSPQEAHSSIHRRPQSRYSPHALPALHPASLGALTATAPGHAPGAMLARGSHTLAPSDSSFDPFVHRPILGLGPIIVILFLLVLPRPPPFPSPLNPTPPIYHCVHMRTPELPVL